MAQAREAVFLDTGYLIALEAADDAHHQAATAHWRAIAAALPQLVTTSYILSEVVTFFNARGRHAKAVEIGRRLLESPSVRLLHVDEELFQEGWRVFVQSSDKTYSLADCISFSVMRRLGLRKALCFDRHFTQAGFERLP